MTATKTTIRVATNAGTNAGTTAKPVVRLGRGVAFGSEFGGGMTLREYIATVVFAGMVANGHGDGPDEDAADAVRYSDALLRELAK